MLRRLATLVALVALIAGACGSSAPALTDPKEILSQSIATLQAMKSFHLHVDLSGTVNVDLRQTGKASPLDLQGTTADVDVDVSNNRAKVSVSAPAFFLTADLIQIGPDTYVKAPLFLGSKYNKLSLASLLGSVAPGLSPAPSLAASSPSANASAVIQQIKDGLGKLTVPPVKDADEKVGDQDCYKVTVKLSQADVSAAGASLPPAASGMTFDGSVDVWVRKSDLRPAKLVATVNAGAQGTIAVTVTLSNIDASVTIDAPPADQIAP